MGILSGLVAPLQVGAYGPIDDFWYTQLGTQSATGIRVDAEAALKTSAVYACVDRIAANLAQLPLPILEYEGDNGRRQARDYYLYDVLHNQPNREQGSMEFREMLTGHCLLRGNAYARIVPGRRGFADQLIPLHPDRITPERLNDGAIRYRYREASGQQTVYNDDEIFHLRYRSNDGLRGLSVIEYARESIGLALATEQHGARLFSQSGQPGGVLTHPGKLSPEGQKKLKASWDEAHSGLGNAHKTAVLEEGMKWESITMTNEDAQFLSTREFQVSDVARWFNVPLHMIQETAKTTSWGSGIEQLSLAFVVYTLQAWAVRWEQAIRRDLITEPTRYYAKHQFGGLLRGDLKTRYDAYATARNWGWLSVNDIRELEDLNPVETGDVYLQPLNMVEAGSEPPAPEPAPIAPPPAPAESTANTAHYWLLLREASLRIVRREIAALSKAAKRHADDPAGWDRAVAEFYGGDHADYVATALAIGRRKAEAYCAERRQGLVTGGAQELEDSEMVGVERLMLLAGGPLAA